MINPQSQSMRNTIVKKKNIYIGQLYFHRTIVQCLTLFLKWTINWPACLVTIELPYWCCFCTEGQTLNLVKHLFTCVSYMSYKNNMVAHLINIFIKHVCSNKDSSCSSVYIWPKMFKYVVQLKWINWNLKLKLIKKGFI